MSASASFASPEFDVETFRGLDDGNGKNDKKLERIRDECMGKIRSATLQTRGVLSEKDVEAYREQVLSDRALRVSGYMDAKTKIEKLTETRDRFIPEIITDAFRLENALEQMLSRAVQAGGISKADAAKWMGRLQGANALYYKKKEFVTQKIERTYLPNWIRLGEDLENIRKKREKLGLKADALPELARLASPGFLDIHFLTKRDYANQAEAALAAFEKGEYRELDNVALYQQAQEQLDAAVEMGALAPWKVGEWLKRIFVKNAKPEKIRNFIEGKGETTLWRIIERWSAVRKKFDGIEHKREEKGSPRGFHFVHINVFLGWHYEKRKAYVEEADHRFTNIEGERESFLKIRHALDVKDWDEADELIADTKREDLSPVDQKKLQSMEKFLREHRKTPAKNEHTGNPSPEELLMKMRGLVDQAPESLQSLYAETMRRGYNAFWTFSTLLYNRDWCYRHHYLDEEKEHRLYEDSHELTAQRIKHGHGNRFEAQDVTSGSNNQDPAIRDQSDVNAAQVLFCDSSSKERILNAIQRQGSDRQFWYWTSLVPKDVSMARHMELTRPGGVNAQLKKMMKQLDRAGVRFTRSGPPDYKYQAKASLN